MSVPNLVFVQPKNKLKDIKRKNDIINVIEEKIKAIKDYSSLKFDNEMLSFVCHCIENGLKNPKKKIDKKELCLEIYEKVFTLNATERTQISNSIEFLCDNDLIITIPNVKKYTSIISNYLKSKL